MCTNEQANWWFHCIRTIETKRGQHITSNTKLIQQLNNGIEIIRLKRVQSKQLNIQICIKAALYLENLLKDSENNNLFFARTDLNELIPFNIKQKYLNLYATQYWCYIANYLKITFNLEDEITNTSLNDSLRITSNLDSSMFKKRTNLFFDILENLEDLHINEQFNIKIYQLANLYLARKKLIQGEFANVQDLIHEINFDKHNFNDKIEYKVAKVAVLFFFLSIIFY